MVRKKKLGKIVGNWNGIHIRHTEVKGGRLGLYRGKNRIGSETYGNYEDAKEAAIDYTRALHGVY